MLASLGLPIGTPSTLNFRRPIWGDHCTPISPSLATLHGRFSINNIVNRHIYKLLQNLPLCYSQNCCLENSQWREGCSSKMWSFLDQRMENGMIFHNVNWLPWKGASILGWLEPDLCPARFGPGLGLVFKDLGQAWTYDLVPFHIRARLGFIAREPEAQPEWESQ